MKDGKEEFQNNKRLYDLIMTGGIVRRLPLPAIKYKQQPSAYDIRMSVIENRDYDSEVIEDKEITDERIMETLKEFGRRFFHDEVRDSGSWKRVVIMCLRSDIKGTYMGFSQSYEERVIRAKAEAAFAETKELRDKKIKEFEELKKKMEEENKKKKEQENN